MAFYEIEKAKIRRLLQGNTNHAWNALVGEWNCTLLHEAALVTSQSTISLILAMNISLLMECSCFQSRELLYVTKNKEFSLSPLPSFVCSCRPTTTRRARLNFTPGPRRRRATARTRSDRTHRRTAATSSPRDLRRCRCTRRRFRVVLRIRSCE